MTHDSINNLTTAGGDTPQRKLGKYLLQRLLGRGGMGEVWLARDTLADIEVALKMLPPELRHSEEAQDQIRLSYQRVHKLGHPNICAVKDLVTDPGTGYFLVMDYFEGVTLSKYRAKQGWMTVEEVVRLLTPVAQALDYAHSLKLAHRDIKPGNILVSEDGQQVRVIDFQLASDIRASVSRLPNAPVNTSGTYPYMAPEQFLGQRASAQTDLYALAMVAYELLDGQLPYEAHSWDQWRSIVTDERSELPRIDDIPLEVQLALEAGLSRDKSRRAGTCSEWVQSLTAATRVDTLREPTPSPTPQIVVRESPRPPAQMKAPFSTEEARTGQEAWAMFLGQSVIETNSIGMELALIPPGEFLMGSSDADVAAALAADDTMKTEYMNDERPQHPVRLTRPFRMGTHPVTQRDFQQIMGRNPSHFSSTGGGKKSVERVDFLRCPVETVSWFDAVEFCNKLSDREGLPLYYSISNIEREKGGWIKSATVTPASGAASAPRDSGYRLPTEAEWEYACRAGTTTAFHFGNVLNGDKANVDGNYPFGTKTYLQRTSVVGSYPANAFGLRDTCGNVWEWCSDGYDENFYGQTHGLVVDPECLSSDRRVLRGGSWDDSAGGSRSASRSGGAPKNRFSDVGFRVSRTQ